VGLKTIPEVPGIPSPAPVASDDGNEYKVRMELKLSDRLSDMLEELRIARGSRYAAEVLRSLILEAYRKECRKDRTVP